MNEWKIISVPFLVAITLATIVILIGKSHREPNEGAVASTAETNKTTLALRKSAAIAEAWEKEADIVFTTYAVTGRNTVRLERPFAVTNEIVTARDFERVLRRVTNHELALIESYAFGFDTNQLTNAAFMLKRAGFQNVRAVVLRWGMRFEGPTL